MIHHRKKTPAGSGSNKRNGGTEDSRAVSCWALTMVPSPLSSSGPPFLLFNPAVRRFAEVIPSTVNASTVKAIR